MASFVVVGQNAEFFKHSKLQFLDPHSFGSMQISFSFHDYKLFCSVVEMFRSWTPKYSEVLRSTRSTSEYSWSKLGVLQSTPELLRSTPEYSGILSSTPEYSKVLQNIVRRKHQFLLRLKSGCCWSGQLAQQPTTYLFTNVARCPRMSLSGHLVLLENALQ